MSAEHELQFSHRPVMLDECIENLAIKPDGIYVDGTACGYTGKGWVSMDYIRQENNS